MNISLAQHLKLRRDLRETNLGVGGHDPRVRANGGASVGAGTGVKCPGCGYPGTADPQFTSSVGDTGAVKTLGQENMQYNGMKAYLAIPLCLESHN